MKRSLGVALALCVASPAFADRPIDKMVWEDLPPSAIKTGAAPYNTIFLNRCANGCTIHAGQTDSRTDTSSLVNRTYTLTAFPGTDAQWKSVVDCVKDVFSLTGANVTDVDPGTASHFEILIAGAPQDVGMSANLGGVSPYQCQTSYIDNSMVFDFAKVWQDPNYDFIEESCATAAQEIAHSFRLDHVIDPSDPMTYFQYTGRRYFKNSGQQCGSDCVNGTGPFGQTCTGQSHSCSCTGQQTQNEIATMQGLFGPGPGTPPVVTFMEPHNGDNVSPGFPIAVEIAEDAPQGIQKADFFVDGVMVSSLVRGPFVINSPSTLTDGTHKIEIDATDYQGTVGKGTIEVYIGPPCQKPSDCEKDTDTCIGGRCVPGPGVQGGLGSTCTSAQECASGICASDDTDEYCVEPCAKGQCPSGFGCEINDGDTMGVCWPGYDDGSGGCSVAPGGAVTSGLLFAALVFGRRRRRRG
jgi:hypothetical protein